MSTFDSPAFENHEAVHFFNDPPTGLKAIIAIHSTALGPAVGGCRAWHYESEDTALTDVLRLARGMSYKNAIAGIPFGGGKAVMLRDADHPPTPAAFEALGRAVDSLGGRYVTAEDVGVSKTSLEAITRGTRYVCGVERDGSSMPGGPSPRTAIGVFHGIRAAVRSAFGKPHLEGLRVSVQGLGSVGMRLCEELHAAGAQLIVADLNPEAVDQARSRFGAQVSTVDRILFETADVVAPCALGGILHADSIPQLDTRIIAGAANNQLATDEDGERLLERGILYAPDYVINAGGIIHASAEYLGGVEDNEVMLRIEALGDVLEEIFEQSRSAGLPTHRIADQTARMRLDAARAALPPLP